MILSKMKKSKKLISLLSTFLLVACSGTYVKLPQVEPAAFNMHRGSLVAIDTKGHLAYTVGAYVTRMLKKDGYYQYTLANRERPDYTISIFEYGAGVVCVVNRGRDFSNDLYECKDINSQWGDMKSDEPTEKLIARRIYHSFVPHKGEYWVNLKVDEDEDPTLAKAVEALQAGDKTQALTLTEQAISEHPKDPETYYLKGILIRDESRFAESDAYLNHALELDPNEKRYIRALQKNDDMRIMEQQAIEQLKGM